MAGPNFFSEINSLSTAAENMTPTIDLNEAITLLNRFYNEIKIYQEGIVKYKEVLRVATEKKELIEMRCLEKKYPDRYKQALELIEGANKGTQKCHSYIAQTTDKIKRLVELIQANAYTDELHREHTLRAS